MASKKQKIKAARAREAERLYYKEHPEELEAELEAERAREAANKAKKRSSKKDSKGKQIPTESERRKKGNIPSPTGFSAKTGEEGEQKGYKVYSSKSSHVEGKVGHVVALAGKHPFISALIVLTIGLSVFGLFSLFSAAGDENDILDDDEKAVSLIGMTDDSMAIVESAEVFDGFFLEEKTNIEFAKLFDHHVTDEEAKVLRKRKQMIDGNGKFSYNSDIAVYTRDEEDEDAGISDNKNTDTSSASK